MDENVEIVLVAFLAFLAVLFIDVSVAPAIPWGVQTVIYWVVLYCSWLIAFPICMAARWSPRNVSKLLALSLVFWSIEDPLYYHLRGYSAFSPFPENPGMYPLMIYWWPVWFMILSRLFAGLVILVYASVNPEWGEERLEVFFTKEEIGWILKVAVVICVAAAAFGAWYLDYSRAGFGGHVLFEVDLSYKEEESPETVFRGVLTKMQVESPLPMGGVLEDLRYVLVRPQTDLVDLVLVKFKESKILDSYLGKKVEILGKLVWRQNRRELLSGRIREAEQNEKDPSLHCRIRQHRWL